MITMKDAILGVFEPKPIRNMWYPMGSEFRKHDWLDRPSGS